MLRLLVISPDNTLYQGDAYNDSLEEMAALAAELAENRVHTALWSHRPETAEGGVRFEDFFSNLAGVDVPFFQAGAHGLPTKPSGGSIAPLLEHFGVEPHEVALVGGNKSDLRAATNNRLLLLRPSWYRQEINYGLEMQSVHDLRRFCMIFGMRQHPVFWQVRHGRLDYSAMGPFSTFIEQYADFGHDARLAAKMGRGTPAFWMAAVFSTLYFANIVQNVNYICAYPGHDPVSGSPIRPLLDETLTSLGECLRAGYYGDLVLRHRTSAKSQRNRDARTFANQIDTLILNSQPHRNGSLRPNAGPLDLRDKRVLIVDDICTTGHSLDSGRALIESAGGQAVLFSWLKTISTPFVHMTDELNLRPYEVNTLDTEPSSVHFRYNDHIVDRSAPAELDSMLRDYIEWPHG